MDWLERVEKEFLKYRIGLYIYFVLRFYGFLDSGLGSMRICMVVEIDKKMDSFFLLFRFFIFWCYCERYR